MSLIFVIISVSLDALLAIIFVWVVNDPHHIASELRISLTKSLITEERSISFFNAPLDASWLKKKIKKQFMTQLICES